MIRPATHAGTWYEKKPTKLRQQIANWLQEANFQSTQTIPGFRYGIGPHAGYRFCGDVLAHTYAQLDQTVERIILMGPSHFQYFRGVRTTVFDELATPLGDVKVDRNTIARLESKCGVTFVDQEIDLQEHCWEMHLPFIASVAPQAKVLPLLFGAFDKTQTLQIVKELAPQLDSPKTAVIVSSDFCHWGRYFDYTPFESKGTKIYKYIEALDHEGIELLTSGRSASDWAEYIKRTGNTVCGATPIRGMLMLAEVRGDVVKFIELAYNQSSHVQTLADSSVSYAALTG